MKRWESETRRIVESLYGPSFVRFDGIDVARSYRGLSAELAYGGDIADVFRTDDRLTIVLVDMCGHGMHAARHGALVKFSLRAYASAGLEPVEAVRALNRLCLQSGEFENDDQCFATLFAASIDLRRRTMCYVSAGHEAAFIATASGAEALEPSGPVVGVIDDASLFSQRTVHLAAGDMFGAATDGFNEARNERLAFLGAEALGELLVSNRGRNALAVADAITDRAFRYAGDRMADDVAALVVTLDA